MGKNKKTDGRPRKLSLKDELAVFEMYKNGFSITEIAYKFQVSYSTITRTIRKYKNQNSK